MATPNLRLLLVAALAVALVACDDYGAGDRQSAQRTTTSREASPTTAPPPGATPTTTAPAPDPGGGGPGSGTGTPIPLGGGLVLGSDPETGDGFGGWLAESSPLASAEDGDRWGTDCRGIATCAPGAAPIRFVAVVAAPDGQPLRIDAYDGEHLDLGYFCQDAGLGDDELATLQTLDDGLPAADGTPDPVPVGWYDDAASRFVAGHQPVAPAFCPGDRFDGTAVLTFEVFDPRGVVACARQFPAVPARPLFEYLTDPVQGRVDPSDDDEPGGLTVAETVHRWAPVCELPAAEVVAGVYAVVVRTDLPAVGEPVSGDDENAYALRVGAGPAGTTLWADGRLTLSLDTDRLPAIPLASPTQGGLRVELFDLEEFGLFAAAGLTAPDGTPLEPAEACRRRVLDVLGGLRTLDPGCQTPDLRELGSELIDIDADLDATGPVDTVRFSLDDFPTPDLFSIEVTAIGGAGPGPASPL